MFKRILCVFCSVVMIFSMISPAVYADDEIMNHEHNWVDVPVSLKGEVFGMEYQVSIKHCTICNLYDHTISLAGYSYEYFAMTAAPGVEGVIQNLAIKLYCSIFGENATATKFTPGGGSTSGGGVGRPKGYADDNGTPSISSDGGIIWQPTWDDVLDCNFFLQFTSREYGYGTEYNLQEMKNGSYNTSTSTYNKSFVFSGTQLTVSWNYTSYSYASNGVFSTTSGDKGVFKFKTPIRGYYSRLKTPRLYFKAGNETLYYPADTKNTLYDVDSILSYPGMLGAGYFTNEVSSSHHVWQFYMPQYKIIPFDSADKPTSFTNITINNNTWNGNIYTDNSTNLTYIYPQYTTVNEKNETVTNISNTPIIYNNETKKYYTYDTVTNNYYYITYEQPATPTPSPSPSPAPTETPTPSPDPTEEPSPSPTPAPTEKPGGSISTPETGKPGGDTGDTTGILAVLVEIRDNMIQGFLDIKAAFVAGFAELSANFTLAIENLNVNIQNIFNKKFPDQSTPETALPSPSPSPAPTDPPSPSPAPTDPPSSSPAPDPGKPDSGDKTNNFWTIIFPNGGGSEDGKKGIFWALVSLILALIAFFANLAVGVGYLFPFLPDGVVMTINTCLIVIFLFTIIKFIMRSK